MKKQWTAILLVFTTIMIAAIIVYMGVVRGQNKILQTETMQNGLPENASDNTKTDNIRLNSEEAILESEYLKLFINGDNAEISVLDKRSGQVWYSNPPDIGKDTLATTYIKDKMSSQLTLEYLNKSGQLKEYNSYADSVQKKQFEIRKQGNSVLVTYNFGSDEKGVGYLPQKISKKRLQEVLLNRLKDPDDKDEIVSRYRYLENEGIYERREIPKSVLKRIVGIFEKAGYTAEDLQIDNKENGISDTTGEENAKFTVQLQYALNKDNLLVSVNTENVKENKPFKINTISIMDYFGAAGKSDSGYIFVPDGSGSLIYLNNGKTISQPVSIPVYGEDDSIHADEKVGTGEINRMPVFGLMKNNTSFFAIIEEGDALAKISADTSGRLHSYNVVGSEFTVQPKDTIKLNNREFSVKTPDEMYRVNLKIRYAFLSGHDASYSGMAVYYRNYLASRYGLKKIDSSGDQPFYLELTGVVARRKSMFGIPYEMMLPLTDLKQTNEIINEMKKNQVSNIQLKYTGCFNGGVKSTVSSSLKLEKALGKKEEWAELNNSLKENGGRLYPNVPLLRVYKGSAGFYPSRDAAQYLSRKVGKIYDYSRAQYTKIYNSFSHYILSPNALENVVMNFVRSYEAYDTGGVSLDDLDSEINSDFNKTKPVDRQQAEKIINNQMKLISNSIPHTMLNGGNIYLLPYAKHILCIPEQSNQYQLEDETVPFYQMVLHGYVEYAGKPFNSADDQDLQMNILKSVETGSNVYYSWVGSRLSSPETAEYDGYYSCYYKDWVNEAVQAYREVNTALKKVKGQRIVSHEKLAKGVFKTTYENGKAFIVNYNDEEVAVDGEKVQARQYKIMG